MPTFAICFSKMLFALLLVTALSTTVSTEKARFDNYRVYRVLPATEHEVHLLRELENFVHGLVFWSSATHVNSSVDIMVPPHMLPDYQEIISDLHLNSKLIIENVQKTIDDEQPRGTPRAGFGWTDYYSLDQVYAWLDQQVEQNPGIVSSIIGGTTYEGRQIKGLKISYKSGNPGVIIESGIHSREWITVATITYVVNELLTSDNLTVRNIAENYDWYIFPTTNPDGYVYTFTTNRMWRKTRSPGVFCRGTDPNRNWDYNWMNLVGASNNPCTETFAGNRVFSEVETRSLAAYLTDVVAANDIQAYLCFHSFSQLLMVPFGLKDEFPDNYDELMEMADKAVKKLEEVHGTPYKIGTIHDAIYAVSGSSLDWVKNTLKIPYTFVWELRDLGSSGFLLPPAEIIPNSEETMASVVSILEDIQERISSS